MRPVPILIWLAAALLAGCAMQRYEAQPIDPRASVSDYFARSLDDPAFAEFLRANGRDPGAAQDAPLDFELLTLAAFYFSPQLRAAEARLRVRRAAVQTARQRINPNMSVPWEFHSDTAGGRSPWLIGLVFDLVYERAGKRAARVAAAEAMAGAAAIALEEAAWNLCSELRAAYIEYYGLKAGGRLLEAEQALVDEAVAILDRRFEVGESSAVEVGTYRLARQRVHLELTLHQARSRDALQELAALTGLPPARVAGRDVDLALLEAPLPLAAAERESIQALALRQRYDVQHALLMYEAVEQALILELEKQYPDVTLSPGFVFDQDDKIWALGTAWMLPIFHRNEGPIAEALARRSLEQAEFLALQQEIISGLSRHHAGFLDMARSLEESGELIAQLRARRDTIRRQFELGYSDRLEVVQAELEVVKAEQAHLNIRMETLRAAQRLEAVMQAPLFDDFDVSRAAANLFALEGDAAGEGRP